MIQRLSYYWGLYATSGEASAKGAVVVADWNATSLPPDVAGSFASEGIGELEGTFGDASLGQPVEVDDLDVETDSKRVRIRVYNRGIGLIHGGVNLELVRLHRFFSTIQAASASGRTESRRQR